MITIKINIPQWTDITKWFWDKFCFPRRKVVAEYFELYNDEVVAEFIEFLYEEWDCQHDEISCAKLNYHIHHLREIMEKKTNEIESAMYKYK